jgi:hypothetical protein
LLAAAASFFAAASSCLKIAAAFVAGEADSGVMAAYRCKTSQNKLKYK